jgi:hypothetical protein
MKNIELHLKTIIILMFLVQKNYLQEDINQSYDHDNTYTEKQLNRCKNCKRRCPAYCKKKRAFVGILGGGAIGAGIGAAVATKASTGALIGGPIGALSGLIISQI